MGSCKRWRTTLESESEVGMINKEILRIENLIKSCNVKDYKINYKNTSSCELYYVLNKLETAREVNVEEIYVTIYKDFDGFKGSSVFTISPSYSDDEVKVKINNAYDRCGYVKNQYFELPEKEAVDLSLFKFDFEEDLNTIATNIAKQIFKADVYREGWINSTEIFVSKITNEFLSSKGVNVKYPMTKVVLEIIPTWSGDKEEVELYFTSQSCKVDYEKIFNDVNNLLLNAKNRSKAGELQNVKSCKVILGEDEVRSVVREFTNQLSYEMQFRRMSKFKVNDNIQTGDECDKLNVIATPYLDNSTFSSPIDSLGTVLKDTVLIDNGIVVNLYGDAQSGYYLGIKKPTGGFRNVKVNTGSKSYSEMTSEPYLECLYFSSFQMDSFTGYYGGEVRLGIYFDGNKKIPVSGFSISGNIYEDINKMKFSKEKTSIDGYEGPKYLEVLMSIN